MEILTQIKAEQIIKNYAPIAKSILTMNINDAVKFTDKFPVVLKIISPDTLHKTEISGVRIVKNSAELEREFVDLLKIAQQKNLKLDGILVQEFVQGEEVIIGIKKDATFNHVIAFGLGGVLVEVLKDVTFRVCPITEKDAQSMIDDLKSKQILYGVRGKKAVNLNLLKKVLVSISKIPQKYKNIEELDINPFVINEKEGKVADVRIVLS